jgi:hypothetical protein
MAARVRWSGPWERLIDLLENSRSVAGDQRIWRDAIPHADPAGGRLDYVVFGRLNIWARLGFR